MDLSNMMCFYCIAFFVFLYAPTLGPMSQHTYVALVFLSAAMVYMLHTQMANEDYLVYRAKEVLQNQTSTLEGLMRPFPANTCITTFFFNDIVIPRCCCSGSWCQDFLAKRCPGSFKFGARHCFLYCAPPLSSSQALLFANPPTHTPTCNNNKRPPTPPRDLK